MVCRYHSYRGINWEEVNKNVCQFNVSSRLLFQSEANFAGGIRQPFFMLRTYRLLQQILYKSLYSFRVEVNIYPGKLDQLGDRSLLTHIK